MNTTNKPLDSPLVSVITVNYRQAEVTCDLLRSIGATGTPNLEVIVVDNGALEDVTDQFKQALPGVKVIVSDENLGFAGGNNLGLKVAKGDYYFLVNNDTEWTDGLVETLLERFAEPKTGAVSPKIRYFDQPDTIQYAGFTRVNPITGRNRTLGQNEVDKGQHDVAALTPYAHGAAVMLSKEAVDKAGLMPEEFFLYYEELDWCEAIRRAGFDIWYEPAAVIYHKESMAVGKLSALKIYYQTRNRILFLKRNESRIHMAAFWLFLTFFTIPKQTIGFLVKKEFELLNAFWRGIGWNLRPQTG